MIINVSTHSRLKAAEDMLGRIRFFFCCFNTQPPEGGWHTTLIVWARWNCFNTQPPEGGWNGRAFSADCNNSFNTQPPEGGWGIVDLTAFIEEQFQHTAAWRRLTIKFWRIQGIECKVSTHSRLKAAEASSKNLISSSLICLISLKSLKKTKNSITQPYSSLHHSSNILIVKEQS